MKKSDVLAAYDNNGENVRRALGYSSTGAIPKWGNVIPEKAALRLDKIKRNGLTYDPSMYKKEIKK